MTKWQTAFLSELSDVPHSFDYVLANQTYFHIGGPAEIFITTASLDAVVSIVKWCHQTSCPLTILGGASNVIVADQGISGVVLKITATEVRNVDDVLYAEAGVKTALLVSQSVQLGFSGLEYFLGVPGTVGGAVLNNAHYMQHLLGDYVSRVQIIDKSGNTAWLDQKQCEFEYDHSRFQTSGEIIWAVEFKLPEGDAVKSKQFIKEATEYRATTQPLGEPSSGCIFQNVPNTPDLRLRFPQFAERSHVPGGFLIDQAGLKGTRIGGVEVSHKHAAFMVNKGGATAADLKALIALVKERVFETFGVHLQEEVFYLGESV